LGHFPKLENGLIKGQLLREKVSFQIGGPADLFVEPVDEAELISVLDYCHKNSLPRFLIGSGTNLLVQDGGFRALVVHVASQAAKKQIRVIAEEADRAVIRVPSFVLKAHLLDWSLENGYEGLEFSSGIPGSLGGGIYMNAGTRWGSYEDVVKSVRFWSAGRGVFELSAAEMNFKYRGHGNKVFESGAIVLSVDIELSKSKNIQSSYSLVSMILSYRGSRQPLNFPNCGSVFKNPENSAKGAGRLIEASGLKGHRIGGAMISDQHANFILNVDHATAEDVKALIALMQQEVMDQFQVSLEPEVILCGTEKFLEKERLDLPGAF